MPLLISNKIPKISAKIITATVMMIALVLALRLGAVTSSVICLYCNTKLWIYGKIDLS